MQMYFFLNSTAYFFYVDRYFGTICVRKYNIRIQCKKSTVCEILYFFIFLTNRMLYKNIQTFPLNSKSFFYVFQLMVNK